MKRRDFITCLGSIAIAAPRVAVAQTSRIYRLGTLTVRLMQARCPLDTPDRLKVSRHTVRLTMLQGLAAACSESALQRFR